MVAQVWQVSTELLEVLEAQEAVEVQLVWLFMLEDLRGTILERAIQSEIHTEQEQFLSLEEMVE
jgi:hypothetical protein